MSDASKELFISVVIPARNEEKKIGFCLQAMKKQDYPADRFEVIVVDDGSTDRTADIVKESGFKCIRQIKQGPAAARNAGVKNARGSIILFTDADCVPVENWISEMIRPFEDPDVFGVKGAYLTRQKSMIARFVQAEFEDRYNKLSHNEFIDFVDTYSGGFRKQIFDELGGFAPEFPVANNEDVELSYRIARQGYRMVFNPDARVYHTHPDSLHKYLSLKFSRGYWRMVVYRKYITKMLKDSYTPQRLKIEIVLAWLFCLLLPLTLLFKNTALAAMGTLLIFMGFIMPVLSRIFRADPLLAIVSPFIMFCRGIVMGLGVIVGIVGQWKNHLLIPILLVFSDMLACMNAYFCALWLRTSGLKNSLPSFDHSIFTYVMYLPFILVLWILVFNSSRLYRPRRSITNLSEMITVGKTITLGIIIIMAVSYAMKYDYSRSFVMLFWGVNIIFTILGRIFVRMMQRNLLRSGFNIRRILLIGKGELGRMVIHNIASTPDLGLRIVGVVDEGEQPAQLNGLPYLGSIANLDTIIAENRIDEVLIAKPSMPHEDILNLIAQCDQANVNFKIVSDLFEIITSKVELDGIGDMPVVDLRDGRISTANAVIKRIVDVIVATVLLVVSLPFWLFIILAIKRESKGKAIFKQTRVGYQGKEFMIYKFRTMFEETEKFQKAPTNADDKRVTRIGRFLRRTSLDELPQLINVLKGEMSMVGPRPEMPFIVEHYDRWQRKRLEVKPGITGLWQILGRKELPLHENLEFDFFYMKNQSLLLDLTILLKTVPLVLTGKGAF